MKSSKRPLKISLAEAMGTCFGVRDAIDAALDESFRDNLTIVGQLVHNPQVIARLEEHGVSRVDSPSDPIPTKNVMITAHGAAASVKSELERRGHTVYDSACPLVLKVHTAIKRLVRNGYFPVIVGQRDHVEVRGIVGDLAEYEVVGGISEIERLAGRDRLGIVAQTTQQVETVEEVVAAIRRRLPAAEVCFVDTVCKPTKDRQTAVKSLAERVDVMIVVGGANSSNTKKLKRVCEQRGLDAHHVVSAKDLCAEWFAGKSHVGITAGTSTPDFVIDEVHAAIRELAEKD